MNLDRYLEKAETGELDNIPTKVNARLIGWSYELSQRWALLMGLDYRRLTLTVRGDSKEHTFTHIENGVIFTSLLDKDWERNKQLFKLTNQEVELETVTYRCGIIHFLHKTHKRYYFVQNINGIKLGL